VNNQLTISLTGRLGLAK